MHIQNLLIFESRWLHLIILVSITSEKFEFYEYKMYQDIQKGILHISSGNCDSYVTPNVTPGVTSSFHHDFIIIILLILDALLFLVLCHIQCVKSVHIQRFFWFVFSRIRTEYSEYRKIRTRKNSVFGQFPHSDCYFNDY